MADVAADIAALLNVVGWDRIALAGLSFGGTVAQEFAVTWCIGLLPERGQRSALLLRCKCLAWLSFRTLQRLSGPRMQKPPRG